ncbi:general substrate transporter [Ascodesmis nigricans]|uniref:General substrate transporter n=1 Tax=Ascodesmis nigricans TaxID=341454 RepID=A0A4S2N5S3_9PEZI|nr:general substrate transporter [Ascodesmis nigricans]
MTLNNSPDDDKDLEQPSRDTSPLLTSPRPIPLNEPVAKGNWIWLLTLSAGISGLLFGYDTASISGALLHLGNSLSTPGHPVTTWDKSMIASATSLGALFGGLIAGVAADKFGRRAVIFAADVGFAVGALWQALSGTVGSMILGRIVVGVSVGIASLIVPLYISELSPASHRGRLVVISVLFITIGQLFAYAVSIILSPPRLSPDSSWRWTLGLGGAPAVVQLFLMVFMPETPRWQFQHLGAKAAAKTLAQVYGTDSPSVITPLVDSLAAGIPSSPSPGLKEKLRMILAIPGNRRALIIACSLQFLQQACGFNALMYFSPTIFSKLGVHSPTATAMIVAFTNAVATFFAFHLIDHAGRRTMLLHSLEGMFIGLCLCSFIFFTIPFLSPDTSIASPVTAGISILQLSILLLGTVIFVSSYALGLGAIPWLCQSEFFPMNVRGVGTGAATATNWFWNLVVAAGFLMVVELVGAGWCFLAFAVVVAGGWVFAWGRYPETKGMRMEEIERLLKDGWGVL